MPDPVVSVAVEIPAEPVVAAAVEPAVVETPSEAPVTAEPSSVVSPADAAVASDGASEDPPAVTLHTDTPGLLAASEPAKAAEEEPKPPVEEPATPTAPVVEPLTYEPPTLPEGMTLDAERVAALDGVIGPHQLPPEARQQLVDMHVAAVQQIQEHAAAEQHRVWGETRANWRTEIMADEQLGGSGFETNRAAAVRMLQTFVPAERREAFDQALMLTGMTDNPEFFRFLVNIARKFDEPSPAPLPRNPPPDIGKNPGMGRRLNYDNPTSPRANGAL